MTKVYTTQELIEILAAERQACLQGQRLNLAAQPSGNIAIDKYLKPEGLQKFTAYQDFKVAVHNYQREHSVSGIVWRQMTVKGKTIAYPEVDAQLIALPEDLEILQDYRIAIADFWQQVTVGMDVYLSINHGKGYRQITPADVERIMHRTQWATLWKSENINFLEIILQLGWGQPQEAAYKRGWPDSGSEYIHAVNPGNRPIC
jgi:hypothetical protein